MQLKKLGIQEGIKNKGVLIGCKVTYKIKT